MTRLEIINRLRKNNGSAWYNSREYALLTQPEVCNFVHDVCYEADAIMVNANLMEFGLEGWESKYRLRWRVLDNYDPMCDPEENACDWSSPDEVMRIGEFNAMVEYGVA